MAGGRITEAARTSAREMLRPEPAAANARQDQGADEEARS